MGTIDYQYFVNSYYELNNKFLNLKEQFRSNKLTKENYIITLREILKDVDKLISYFEMSLNDDRYLTLKLKTLYYSVRDEINAYENNLSNN